MAHTATARSTAPNRTLRCIEFTGAAFGEACAEPIAHIILTAANHALRSLRLTHNTHRFSSDAFECIATALARRFHTPPHFVVDIEDRGAHFYEVMRRSTTMQGMLANLMARPRRRSPPTARR